MCETVYFDWYRCRERFVGDKEEKQNGSEISSKSRNAGKRAGGRVVRIE